MFIEESNNQFPPISLHDRRYPPYPNPQSTASQFLGFFIFFDLSITPPPPQSLILLQVSLLSSFILQLLKYS
ncbi:hypothetical protein K2173_025510 [Erythroxylum novogranatense]|uniref:Uncharacterized protein n=1 Tax=Erythroxylum novogranatense TaxID=1862640 RepID=A0AAV8TA89_9ROSI|nr:hypothetical protein K2173_025510 [Erythroxylum novogranatense]